MNTSTSLQLRKLAVIVLLNCLSTLLWAQTNYRSASSDIIVAGTSTMHDWKEKSSKGTAVAVFTIDGDKISGLSTLVFTIPVKSLKSENSSMDNNTYKALKADKHVDISYVLSSATVTPVNATTYTINTKGKLTIAGTTRETDVVGTAKLNADQSLTVTGTKKFKMTDYNVTPPKVMMMKTGNEVTITYNLKMVK